MQSSQTGHPSHIGVERRAVLALGIGAAVSLTVPASVLADGDDPYAILDTNDVRHPFDWIQAISMLWQRGDRLQSSFWYYVFQIRSRPWAEADMTRTGGSGHAALRASITEVLGAPVNEWLGSDPAVWRETWGRAIAFERTLPFHAARPQGVDQEAWAQMNARARSEHQAGYDQLWERLSTGDMEELRRERGLYVGPLRNPGRPLIW